MTHKIMDYVIIHYTYRQRKADGRFAIESRKHLSNLRLSSFATCMQYKPQKSPELIHWIQNFSGEGNTIFFSLV